MNLADILGNVFSGGLTGLIGIGVQRYYEYKTKQLDLQAQNDKFSHEIDMKRQDLAIMAQEWAGRTSVASVEASDHANVADSQAFQTALTSEPSKFSDASKLTPEQEWVMVGLDLVRGLIRPTLTIYLCLLTTLLYFQTKGVPPDASVLKSIIDTILYLTTTCVLFWFGSRNKK